MDRRRLLGGAAGAAFSAGAIAAEAMGSPNGLFHGTHGRIPPAPIKRRAHGETGPDPVAPTTAGPIRGKASGGLAAFKGVPYGASTAGANRFMPPRKPHPWTDVRDATAYGPISPQPLFPVIPEENDSEAHEPQGEDCLRLNVWTPALGAADRQPVMVWFHGGGYTVGGGSAPWYDGSNLAARHGVVVVTINHRLNVVGFLSLAEVGGPAFADSGNVGMLDCVAALEWVRDNIANFGGDPANVTIFGESGGAGKVSTLMAMPAARGLFHRAIAQSGAALRHATPVEAAKAAKGLLDTLGVGPGEIAKLQAMPIEDIIKAMGQTRLGGGFGPVVDGRSIPNNPWDPSAPTISADVPFLTGSNLTEATFFLDTPLDPLGDAELLDHVKAYTHTDAAGAAELIAVTRAENPSLDNVFVYQLIASEYWMRTGVLLQAERKAALGRAPVYVYQFNKLSPARGGKLHCPHGSEIPFVFDDLESAPDLCGSGPAAQGLADLMSAAWASFARTGDPNPGTSPDGGLNWRPYDSDRRQVMVFDTQSRVVADPGGKTRAAIAKLKASQA